jgi:hypothetical protein
MTSSIVEGVRPPTMAAENRHRLLGTDALEGGDRRHDLVKKQRRAAPLAIAEVVSRKPSVATRHAEQTGRVIVS